MQKKSTVAITGGNSGIGLATSKLYLEQGHNVAVLSRSIGALKELTPVYPDQLLHVVGDVSKTEDLVRFYELCSAKWQSLDIVVANAGHAKMIPLEEVSDANFQNTFDTNVKGAFFTAQKALPFLKRGAAITFVGSIEANRGAGSLATYSATKAAVRSLTRSFAAELGSRGIRVNCISPGVTETPIFNKFGISASQLSGMLDSIVSATPVARIGQPREIAEAIEYISSDRASFVHGSDLHVDGGLAQI